MQIKPELKKEYDEYVEKNSHDEYSHACVEFWEKWAHLMESKIKPKKDIMKQIVKIADKCCHEADEGIGITGFMYGCAVSALSKHWIYGEELRKWHNKEYNYEGNGVLNPAILTIKTKEE